MATTSSLLGGGGIKSIQTGYVDAINAGTGEDVGYADATISAVVIAKSVVLVQGYSTAATGNTHLTGRLTTTTNVRISSPDNGSYNIRARYYVIEFN